MQSVYSFIEALAAMFVCVSSQVQLLICERRVRDRKDRRTIADNCALGFCTNWIHSDLRECESRTQLRRHCTFALSPFYLTGAPISRCIYNY
jgi:hypothetical protein